MKKYLRICEECSKNYEGPEVRYQTEWVEKQLLERDILARENAYLRELFRHYRTILGDAREDE